MIVTFTPNPAIDMTYDVDGIRVGKTHVVQRVRERAGGKGVNSAGVLTGMGIECVALAPVGADDADTFAADLSRRGVRAESVPVPGRVRRSVAVIEPDGTATVFNERGTAWPAADVLTRLDSLLTSATALAACGSLPDGSEGAALDVLRHARARSARLVLDLRGPVLRDALALEPDLVKPNRAEACATLDLDHTAPPSAPELARRLIDAGARAAAVSDGPRGVALATRDGLVAQARLSKVLQGNATGAGDALTAAFAHHLAAATCDWIEALRDGVAWSAAAVLQPVAGQVDPSDVERLRTQVVLDRTVG